MTPGPGRCGPSARTDGAASPRSAASVSLSPSGRFVAYCSTDELVGPDSSDVDDNTPNTDVFVRDMEDGHRAPRVVGPGGGEGDEYSCFPDVADTGDVVFFSRATNLVTGDTNGVPDYFLYDRGSRKVRRLATAEIASGSVRLSADGRVAAVVTTEVLASRDSGDAARRVRPQPGPRPARHLVDAADPGRRPADRHRLRVDRAQPQRDRALRHRCLRRRRRRSVADRGQAGPPVVDRPPHR